MHGLVPEGRGAAPRARGAGSVTVCARFQYCRWSVIPSPSRGEAGAGTPPAPRTHPASLLASVRGQSEISSAFLVQLGF